MKKTKTLYEALKEAGVPIEHHESDLYFPDTPETRKILKRSEFSHEQDASSTFVSNLDGKRWVDVPFAYDPFWDAREQERGNPIWDS